MNHPETVVAWLAGFLEGEGSFSKGPPSKPNLPRIQLLTTDEDVIARVGEVFGVKYCKIPLRTNTGLRAVKQTYSLQIRGSKAVIWMRRILPYMGMRRAQQINEAIESYKPIRVRYNKEEFNSAGRES